jgi:hypothetical protein
VRRRAIWVLTVLGLGLGMSACGEDRDGNPYNPGSHERKAGSILQDAARRMCGEAGILTVTAVAESGGTVNYTTGFLLVCRADPTTVHVVSR